MTNLRAPRGAADLDAGWLTAALAGVSDGAQVTEVRARRIGNGMVADSIRLGVTWDRPTSAPTSYVAKVPAAEETSRNAAAATRTYLLEARFYNDLAHTLEVHRPECYLALHDEQTNDYVVLLGDLSPAEPGDQITGCSVEAAEQVIPELAALHGPRWEDPTLFELDWLDRPDPDAAANTRMFVDMLFPTFMERYEERLAPGVADLSRRFIARIDEYVAYQPRPWTIVHTDFRLDNLLFGGERVAVLDWQTVRIGQGISDVAYFIGSALLVDERREHEERLVRMYHEELLRRGGEISWDDCWWGYRRQGFSGLLMAILASSLVGRTDRGDDMFMAMANRHGQQLLDLDAESLLTGR